MTAPMDGKRALRYAEVAVEALGLDVRRAHDQMVADHVAVKFMDVADDELDRQAKTRATGYEGQLLKAIRRAEAAEAKVARVEALSGQTGLISLSKVRAALNGPAANPTANCEHWGHAEGEWKYSCCACSGIPNGCERCAVDD